MKAAGCVVVRLGSLGKLFPGRGGRAGAKKYGFILSLAAAVIPSQPSGLFELALRRLVCQRVTYAWGGGLWVHGLFFLKIQSYLVTYIV